MLLTCPRRQLKLRYLTRRYVRFLEPTAAVVGPREAVPGIWLTIAEPVNQVVRPAYAKLDEGCSE
jgi:hypothetical protein